jgi:hypothetical protein
VAIPGGVPDVNRAGLERDQFLEVCLYKAGQDDPDASDELQELRCEVAWIEYQLDDKASGAERRKLEKVKRELEAQLAEKAGRGTWTGFWPNAVRDRQQPVKLWEWDRQGNPVPAVDSPAIKGVFLHQLTQHYQNATSATPEYARQRAEWAWRKSGIPEPTRPSFDAAKAVSERRKWNLATLDRLSIGKRNAVKGYAVTWGLPDANGYTVTPQTDLWLDRSGEIPVTLYEHGGEYGQQIGKASTRRKDDVGTWLQTQLEIRSEFEQMIMEQIGRGKLYLEPGVPYARPGKSLTIAEMPLLEVSLVPELDANGYRLLSDSDLRRLGHKSMAVKSLLGAL